MDRAANNCPTISVVPSECSGGVRTLTERSLPSSRLASRPTDDSWRLSSGQPAAAQTQAWMLPALLLQPHHPNLSTGVAEASPLVDAISTSSQPSRARSCRSSQAMTQKEAKPFHPPPCPFPPASPLCAVHTPKSQHETRSFIPGK